MKKGSNQHRKKLKPFAYVKALGFVSFWLFIFLYCVRVGIVDVVLPWTHETFKMTVDAPTLKQAYAESKTVSIVTPTPYIPTKKDIIFTQKHGDIIWRIYGLESSFGQEPYLYCTHQGLVSDMGFNVLNHQCFTSFTQEVQTVEKWLEAHEGMPLGQELCLYNTGKINGCNYEENFLSL